MATRKTALRRIGAVFAGLLVIVVTSTVTDAVLHATGVFPPSGQPMADSLFLLATAYRAVYGIAGAYVTARLAPSRPMWHAIVLGAIGVAAATVGAVATWDRGPEFGPHWYPILLIAITLPCSWAGAKLFEIQARGRSAAPTYAGSR
jgi:hypothetical protein